MIPNRAPSTTWCLKRDDPLTRVQTEANDEICVIGPDFDGRPTEIFLSRSDARLLAKRINQCLDATVKR